MTSNGQHRIFMHEKRHDGSRDVVNSPIRMADLLRNAWTGREVLTALLLALISEILTNRLILTGARPGTASSLGDRVAWYLIRLWRVICAQTFPVAAAGALTAQPQPRSSAQRHHTMCCLTPLRLLNFWSCSSFQRCSTCCC